MKINMSITDRWVRLVLAAVMAGLFFGKVVEGVAGYVLLGLAAIFVLTAMIRFCPLYLPFGISTIRKTKK